MILPFHKDVILHKYINGIIEPHSLPVPTEYTFSVFINRNPYLTFASSGNDIEAMATGLLLSKGIFRDVQEIQDLTVDYKKMAVFVISQKDISQPDTFSMKPHISSSNCGSGPSLSENNIRKELPLINGATICNCSETFSKYSDEHTLTHGVHSSAIYNKTGEQLAFFDDIGRHNAIDKAIGFAAINGIALKDSILFSTGRISGEIISKVLKTNCTVFCSLATVTDQAVDLIHQYNILTCCKTKKNSFIIINGREYIQE